MPYHTLRHAVDLFEAHFQVRRLLPYQANVGKRFGEVLLSLALKEQLGMAHTSQQSMHMKDRLTVTVDAELAAHARQVAHSRGTSVSGLLESLLREALASRPKRSPAFADRWSGRFSVTPNTSGDARLTALKAKHSLA